MAKEPTVWISRAPRDTTLIKGFLSEMWEDDRTTAVEAMKKSAAGVLLPSERFPKEFWGKYRDKTYKKNPDIFYGGGFWCVSKACADVLEKHNLGQTRLYPTKFYQHNRKRPVEGEYFCLALGEQKSALLPDVSPGVEEPGYDLKYWELSPSIKDDETTVDRSALSGPELWVDAGIPRTFFLSDALVQSLKAAKLTRRWGLRRCKIAQ